MELLKRIVQQFCEEYELLVRLILACVLGIAVGFERTNRNKMAGIRTHAVVMFGSALMMIISKYGFYDMVSHDGSRIAAQIVSGVGFLGTGMIFVKDNKSVSGLTTAAGIWATAGIGMSVGAGQYVVAVSSAILLIFMQELLHRVRFLSHTTYHMSVTMTISENMNVKELQEYIKQEKAEIESIGIKCNDDDTTNVQMELVFAGQYDKIAFVSRLSEFPRTISVNA